MPQVPYQPYASEKPTEGSGAHGVRIDAPNAAFGGAVGQALGTLGKTLEHTGDELFKRAVEIQNLQNETDAKEADADYMVKAGKLHADFNALQGKAATEAYPKYVEANRQLRTEIRNSLSNPMAQKLYDGSSLSTMGRNIFNGANHAAVETKKTAIGASEKRTDVMINNVFQAPSDNDLYEQTLGAIKSEMEDQGALRGWDPVQTKDATDKAISRLVSHRITGLAREAPWEAERMLNENRDKIHWQDMERVENTVRTQIRTVGSRNIADKLVQENENSQKPRSTAELVAEGRAQAKALAPKDELLGSYVEDAIIGRVNKQKAIENDTRRENKNIVLEGVQGLHSKDGYLPTTVDELLQTDPKVAAAWDSLKESDRTSIRSQLTKNRKQDFVNSPQREQNFRRLIGMSGTDREGFLDVDIMAEDLTEQQRTQIFKMQRATKVKAEEDPRVNRAMDELKPILRPLGITQKDDPTRYDYFRGSIQLLIEDRVRETGKQPKPEEIRQMGARLLQEQNDPNKISFWGAIKRTSPLFEQEASAEEIEKIQNDPEFQKPGMAPPTKEQIKHYKVRKLYNDLYSKPPKKDQAQVPNRNLPGQ